MRRFPIATVLVLPLLAVSSVEGATQVFYSVGTSRATLTDLKVGSPTITISGGVATFSIAQATNVGVGDEISYGAGPTLIYISGRSSPTQYAVTDRLGAPAANVITPQSVNRIYRAFESLSAAEANSTDGAHLGTADLVFGGDFQLNWPCYNDGVLTDWVLIAGYTTGVTQYIRIYTPTSASEVGVSQRHRGFFGTGFQINVTNNNAIHSTAAYLRVEGLVIQATVTNNFSSPGGIMSGPVGVTDVRISHNIVRGIITPGVTGVPVGIGVADLGDISNVHRVWNNVVYNFTNDAAQDSQGLSLSGGTVYVFNNTVFNSKVGIVELSPVVGGELRNNVSINDALNANNVDFRFVVDLVESHDVSSDATALGAGSLTGRTAYATYFANTIAGTEDFHLRATSLVLWGSNGTDLSGHAFLQVTDDIDGGARVRPDFGADEAGGPMRVKSGTYMGNGTSQVIAGLGFRPDLVIVSADSTDAGVNGSSGHTDVLRTSTMAGNLSKAAYIYSNHPLVDRITSLDPDGFSVGHPPNHLAPNDNPGDPYHCANHAGVRYYWVAFQAAPGEMAVGAYTGNGNLTQDVTTVGFQPDYTLVLSDDGESPIQRFRLMPANYSFDFDGGSQCPVGCTRPPGIRTELATGFQVGQYVNDNAIAYHYVAWKETAGRIKVGTYPGDGSDDKPIGPLGFRPEMVQVVNGQTPVPNTSTAFKTAATGSNSDYSLVYISYANGYQGPDDIQALEADSFQVGQGGNVNDPGDPHYWAAFGPGSALAAPTNYRSIGSAADLVNQGTITLTAGSLVVTNSGGAGWKVANRGRGDRLTVNGTTHYVVAAVNSDDQLVLTSPAVASYTGSTYTIARQFLTLAAWEDCVDGGPCLYFPVDSPSLVADNRNEVGIAYDDNVGADFALTADVVINGSVTDATHTIKLTADGGNRHNGTVDGGVVLDGQGLGVELLVRDSYVTVEWLEFIRFRGAGQEASVRVLGSVGDAPTNVLIQNVLIHDFDDAGTEVSGIRLSGTAGKTVTVRNCMIWDGDKYGIEGDDVGDTLLIDNCSIDNMMGDGNGIHTINSAVTVRNTIVTTTSNLNYDVGVSGSLIGSNNTSSDGSAPGASAQPGVTALSLFVTPNVDLHLRLGAVALDTGLDLSASFSNDIDGQSRLALPWDRGADERGAPTAVKLVSFEAAGGNAAVDLTWETGSELDNLGFHLYRSTESAGPYTRITSRPIPGLGSSPAGAGYRYRDSGLVNGTTYFYKLEDIETTGKTTFHGPVSATPSLSASSAGSSAGPSARSIITYGNPAANGFRVLERSSRGVVVELVTEGFTAEPQEDGSVRLEIPGFEPLKGSPSVPVLRPWVEAMGGREVAISSIRESSVESFEGLRPSGAEEGEIAASRSGTVRARRGRTRKFVDAGALVPESSARLLQVGFQGETKKAQLELAPLRWNGAAGELQLSRRLTVRLSFSSGRGKTQEKTSRRERGVVARLVTTEAGLHEVSYEELFPRRRGSSSLDWTLTRHGEPVFFHVEPAGRRFGPGSRLYFVSEGPEANPYGQEAVYELERGNGLSMEVGSARPSGELVMWYVARDEYEENRFYQAGLLEASDVWLWDVLLAPVTKAFSFETNALASGPAYLTVGLQGVSAFPSEPDHHVRLYVNGTFLEEVSWDGKTGQEVELVVPEGVLTEGANQLEIENVGDTGAAYSMVMLDRFEVAHPRAVSSEGGRLEGLFPLSGTISVGLGPSHLLDVTEENPRWLSGGESGADGSFRFHAEAGRRYLAVSREAVHRPLVRKVAGARLKKETLQSDYLVIGPSAFSEAAAPLLQHRSRQGLRVKFASVEDVYSEFGFGEARPEAVREFLSYAYHHWREPKLRYVLLLGDATYDFKDYLETGVANRVPPLLVKTSYLWTVSDPALAAVNGEDVLPDVAIGRLPAATSEDLSVMVEKVLAYERGEADLRGLVVLVNDNSDRAGDFAANADELARGPLAGRAVSRLDVGELGAATRGEILAVFDEGASLVSYIGHGGIHLWADENVFHTGDVTSLSAQPQQPLLLTMNCLNGYFHFPYFDSLAESLVKAEGKGAIAAFSPSGLSLNEPAHRFHQALLDELLHEGHERLGDAVLAAQERYASTGAFPELLSIYHLLGDPAMTMR